MPPKKNLSRGFLSNWCEADDEADAHADIVKQYVNPHPTGGRHNYMTCKIVKILNIQKLI